MKRRTFITLACVPALAAALSFGCHNAGGTNTPATGEHAARYWSDGAGAARGDAPVRVVTGEPERYSATLRLTVSAVGEHAAALPQVEADVARRGRERRVSFRLPNGEQFVYLKRGGTAYVILPGRERYAVVTARGPGFEPARLPTPDQLVEYLRRQRGFVRAGEEELNGRTVVKYVAPGEARTGTHAGDFNTGSVVYVDKMTELPLRAELVSGAAGEAEGVRGVKVVAELRHVRTEVGRALFAVPRGMEKVEADEVRRQVEALLDSAAGLAGSLLNQMNAEAVTGSPATASR